MSAFINGKKVKSMFVNGKRVKTLWKGGVCVYREAAVLDNETTIFVGKTGITNQIEIKALDTCIKSLKSAGLYSKIRVFYPMVGGTANTTKTDAKSGNNSAYDITWFGGMSFSNLGVKGNAMNGYGDTKFKGTNLSVEDHGFTFAIGSNTPETRVNAQVTGFFSTSTTEMQLFIHSGAATSWKDRLSVDMNNISDGRHSLPISKNNAIYTLQRKTSSVYITIDNGLNYSKSTAGVLPELNLFLFNINLSETPFASGFSQHRIQSFLIHEGFTDAEAIQLQTIINQFESDLGRKTW